MGEIGWVMWMIYGSCCCLWICLCRKKWFCLFVKGDCNKLNRTKRHDTSLWRHS